MEDRRRPDILALRAARIKGPLTEEKATALYVRAIDILDGRATGFGTPILRHLAARGRLEAMTVLADRLSEPYGCNLGSAADNAAAAGLYRRAYRKGHAMAARNLAVSYFNLGNLHGYRHWLARAAKAGDTCARSELRYFLTRMPHQAARRIGRLRPWQRLDDKIW